MRIAPTATKHPLATAFKRFVGDRSFPCVAAKSALGRNRMSIVVAQSMASSADDLAIYGRIYKFARNYRRAPGLYQTLVIVFKEPRGLDERQFEKLLWQRLQAWTNRDIVTGQQPDPRVSSDPGDPNFSISYAGQAFFVVGLHPRASRRARRFRAPAIVLNLHDQFERLRTEGLYDKLRTTILERDKRLQGSENPMLARHGESSEAPQYSGRLVGPDWQCPYHRPTRGTTVDCS